MIAGMVEAETYYVMYAAVPVERAADPGVPLSTHYADDAGSSRDGSAVRALEVS